MANSRKGNLAILRGGHELSENGTGQANHVPELAPNHPSPLLFSATKSMIILEITRQ